MDHVNFEKQITPSNYYPTSTPPALGIRRDSHTITKVKPKIRIIHIFAPEIIKTDVANFRDLVQRLTGKPSDQNTAFKKKPPRAASKKKDETVVQKQSVGDKKDEKSIWPGENPDGFLGDFSELDGFMHELGEFPLFPMDSSHTTTHQDFGETKRLA